MEDTLASALAGLSGKALRISMGPPKAKSLTVSAALSMSISLVSSTLFLEY